MSIINAIFINTNNSIVNHRHWMKNITFTVWNIYELKTINQLVAIQRSYFMIFPHNTHTHMNSRNHDYNIVHLNKKIYFLRSHPRIFYCISLHTINIFFFSIKISKIHNVFCLI
jgi:hypothetical protein